jgi:hypothetical protein
MKIVINKSTIQPYHLYHEEIMRYGEIKGIPIIYESESGKYFINTIIKHNEFHYSQIFRNDLALVQLVEELNPNRKLKVVEIPDDVDWQIIQTANGDEYIIEKYRRYWGYSD